MKNNSTKVVFCDFDGTITAKESFVSMLEEFAPQVAEELLPLIFAQKLTLKAGVKQILGSIPADCYPQILERAASLSIRPGLKELLAFLNAQQIPFIVISGGLRGMVETVLKQFFSSTSQPLINSVTAIHAADIDASGQYLQVYSDYVGDTELVAKAQIMAQYPATETIAIGDSVTDINMALQADLVFARDRLIQYLVAANKPYVRWNDFLEVRDYLVARWS